MRDSDSDTPDRAPLDDDFIAVSPKDCIKAYVEFPSEADLAVIDDEHLEAASGFAAFIAGVDGAQSRSGVDASEQLESTIAVLSSSVPEAKQPTLAWRVDPPNRRVQRIVVAIATVGALAIGVLGGRVLLGPRVVGPAMRVGADPAPAPTATPQTAVVETQAEPAASTIPTQETFTPDRQLEVEAPSRATPAVVLASNSTNNSPRAVQGTLPTPSMTASAVESRPPAVSLPNPPPATVQANSVADLGVGDSAPVARANPPASVTPDTTAATLPAPASPVGTSGALVVNATLSAPIVNTTGEVNRVLAKYQAAFSGLDVEAVRQIWPTANGKALSRAFEQLEEERLTFESCDVRMSGITAAAICNGTMRYVPRVGSKSARVERNQWHLSLREAATGWVVDSVDVRPRR